MADLGKYLEMPKNPLTSSPNDTSIYNYEMEDDSTTTEMEDVFDDQERIMPCTIQRAGESI